MGGKEKGDLSDIISALEYDKTLMDGVIKTIKLEKPDKISEARKIYNLTQAKQRKWIRKFINMIYFEKINDAIINEHFMEYNEQIIPSINTLWEIAYPPVLKIISPLPIIISALTAIYAYIQAHPEVITKMVDLLGKIFSMETAAKTEYKNNILNQLGELMWPPFDDDHVIYLYNKK